MRIPHLRLAAAALAVGIGLGGCAYNPYGGPGVSVGYGNGYYDPYYSGYGYSPYGYSPYGYSSYGYGYGMPYYGWNDGFYYPGSGYYVYDRHRNPYRWTEAQRKYWEWRRRGSPSSTSGFGRIVQNWADFNKASPATTSAVRQESVGTVDRTRILRDVQQRQLERHAVQQQRVESRESARSTRQSTRAERRAAREDRRERPHDD